MKHATYCHLHNYHINVLTFKRLYSRDVSYSRILTRVLFARTLKFGKQSLER